MTYITSDVNAMLCVVCGHVARVTVKRSSWPQPREYCWPHWLEHSQPGDTSYVRAPHRVPGGPRPRVRLAGGARPRVRLDD